MEKKALGRGLSALFESESAETNPRPGERAASGSSVEIPIRDIIPNRYQPRKVFGDPELDQLAASLRENGLIQPVVVRPRSGGGYELIAGERRWRAAERAGMATIPAVVKQASDQQLALWALIENLQRLDLNPIEAARAYRRLGDEFSLTQEEIARQVGRDRSTVANFLRILTLPKEVQDFLSSGDLDVGHGKALLALTDPGSQVEAARRIRSRGLSVRATESLVNRLKRRPAVRRAVAPDLEAAEARLRRRFGTKVRIEARRKGGRILIEYYNATDLDRILGLIQS